MAVATYTHEYTMAPIKDAKGRTMGSRPTYVGSRSNRDITGKRREMLPVVKEHNDATGKFFGTRNQNRVVVK